MNYIGSKLKLSGWIFESVKSVCGEDLSDKIFCDLFAGTGIVGRKFKTSVKKIISNDWESYSFVLNKNYIENHTELSEKENFISYLNGLPARDDGFIYQNYCMGGSKMRQYFSDQNGMKIDAIRMEIENLHENNQISDEMYYFLLCSLLESADKVANTASVYGAYLKKLKKSAQKEMILESADFDLTENVHEVYRENANSLIQKISGDILYLDPPYNERQYGANYHLLNTIAEYKPFKPQGKTGLPKYQKSLFCNKSEVKESFEEILKNADFKYIFLSYNNEGLMTLKEVKSIMQKYGKYSFFQTDYQRFKADKSNERKYKASTTVEYLHILEK